MFKSLKKKPEKVKEKTDFKLSFHATRVPLQGWDKLVISVIPYETGRPVAKTPRAVVRNGNCQWPDSIIESTRLVYDSKTKEYEEKKYKFIISSGSSRSGVLGEATINLGEFASTNNAQQRALPLRNCSSGTLLHVNVTCLTPRTSGSGREVDRTIKVNNDADEEEAEAASDEEDQDNANKAGNTGQGNRGNLQSPRKPALDSPPLSPVSPGARKLQQRHVSQSALRYSSSSFDSLEVPSTPGTNSFSESMQGYQGENFSPSSSFASLPEKLDRGRDTSSQDSNHSSPAPSYTHKRTLSSSAASGGHHQVRQEEGSHPTNWGAHSENTQGEFQEDSTLKANLEAAESTIEELRMEVTSSQRQARKLSVDVQQLTHKLDTEVRLNKEKEMEVSALVAERDGLKQELEQLKSEKQALQDRENGEDDARWAVEEAQRVIQELREEIMLEKNTINNLNLQLHKTHESNMDLVSEIEELEKALEQHRQEADDLKAAKNLELRQPSESENSTIQVESELAKKLAAKEEEIKELLTKITQLEARSSQMQKPAFVPTGDGSDALVNGLQNMVRQLQQDVEELEADTIRLTDENLDLQAKLDSSSIEIDEKSRLIAELKADLSSQLRSPRGFPSHHHRHVDGGTETADEGRVQLMGRVASLEGELSRLKEETTQVLDEKEEAEKTINRLQLENQELEKTVRQLEGGQPDNPDRVKDREVANAQLFQQLADTVAGLEIELQEAQEEGKLSRSRIEELEHEIMTLTSSDRNSSSTELETLRKTLESEKLDKDSIQVSTEEKTRAIQERLDHAMEELEFLKEQLESLTIEKRTVETRSSELELVKSVLEGKLADLEEEKVQLADRVTELELQLKYMTEERDLHQKEAGVAEDEKSYLLSEKDSLQAALDSSIAKHQDLVRHLTEELTEAIKECEVFKSSNDQLEQEVRQLRGELEQAKRDVQQQAKDSENSRAVLEESLQSVSRDHATAVAMSTALQVQVAQLQSDLEDMEMRSATEFRTLSMLKESEQQRAEKAEEALQQSAMLQKEKVALEKRITELELLLEDEQNERALYAEQNGRNSSGANGNLLSRSLANNGHEAFVGDTKALEIEKIKQEYKQKESSLISEIERLELANEQLAEGAPDSDLQQLQVELTRLQNQNAALNRRINELQSQLTTQQMLQSEVERLQEVNEKLDIRLHKYKAAATGADMVERVVHLETELAEAMEANNMYKVQLRSAFAEQQNVHAAALQNFGDVEQVVSDLVELRKRVKQLEGELRDMRDRYSAMSLRFAEVEVEREELVMTIRNLRNGRKQ